jgi:hypothetical protein
MVSDSIIIYNCIYMKFIIKKKLLNIMKYIIKQFTKITIYEYIFISNTLII